MREIQLDDGSRLVRSTQPEAAGQARAADDNASIEPALRDFKGDATAMADLRLLLWEAGVSGLDTMSDDEVVQEVANQVELRRLHWVSLGAPAKPSMTGGSAEPEAAPPPPPPPPPKKEEEKIHVIPELQVEFKVVLFDRDLNKHLGGSDKKHPTDTTYVLVSLRQDTSTPKFTQGAKLIVEGAGKVEAYEDEELKKKVDLAKPIKNDKVMGGSPFKLFLKGKTKGKFTLKLEVESPSDGRFVADPPAEEKMGVVEIQIKPHQQDADKLKDVKVDPDTDPVSKYWDDLKAKALPDQKELGDSDKVKKGRRLHVQKDASFGRAKLIVKKLEAAHWPDGTDDYTIVLTASDSDDISGASTGSLAIADAEFDGTVKDAPFPIKVSDLKGGDKTFWVECKAASKKVLDIRLDAGVETLRDADWARFTGVEIKEVKIDYKAESKKPVAWDEGKEQFAVNFIKGKDGRKVKLVAKLSEKIKDVPVHFMLAPDQHNLKTANWGVDLPGTWKWKDITADAKHLDRKDRKDLLNLSAKTDGEGVAKAEVWLSQFGGDKFHPGAYIDQDPHIAKFVHEHADLGKRKPVFAAKTITVWRKFWYQVVKVEGMAPPAMTGAEGQYTLVKADMRVTPELPVTRKKVDKFSPQAIYPRYMVVLGAGADDALVVSDSNKASFFSGYKAEGDKPIKIPLLICDAQWDKGGNSSSVDWPDIPASVFPLNVTMDKLVLTPPLQGGNLRVNGKWVAKEPDGAGGWKNVRKGSYKNSDLSVDPARTDLKDVQVALPAGAAPIKPDTVIDIEDLVIKGADGPYLGEYDTSKKRILSVFDPTQLVDFQNTIAHEIGHSLHQVTETRPAGIPKHPHQYLKQGSHCRFSTNKCVMYESGPIPGSLNRYCDVCHPYLLVQDMQKLA